MKRFLFIFPLMILLSIPVFGDFSPEENYMSIMTEAVRSGDREAGMEAQTLRDEKIAALGLDYPSISYDDLELLSKLIESEAGSDWLSMEWKLAVGEVVMNRVASPEFPNSLRGVIFQAGQYRGINSSYLASISPSEESVEAARRLLEGERMICDPSVVFQANFPQGSSVHTSLYDPLLGYTYFCCSNYPEYYS